MLNFASLSARRGGKIPVFRLPILSAARTEALSLTAGPNSSQHRYTAGVLSPGPPWLSVGHAVRFVSLSASYSKEVVYSSPSDEPDWENSYSKEVMDSSPSDESDWENFGTLSKDISSRRVFRKSRSNIRDMQHEEDDTEEVEVVNKTRRRRNTPYWYFLQCKKLIKENKLQEALDLFSIDMLKEERLQPEEFNYSVLIGGCGRAGQLKKAFKLYNDLKKRALVASDATYTALFNACAQSPSKQDGLQQALKLEQELRRKNFTLNTITYHALLKTHAMTNHLQACVHTVREMLQNGHPITQETFHYLLMGCVADKEIGFRLALQVWRQMVHSGITPDLMNYNLLLRAARDCGIGDPASATNILLRSDYNRQTKTKGGSGVIDIDLLESQLILQQAPHRGSHHQDSNQGEESSHLMPVRQTENIPIPDDREFQFMPPNLLEIFEGKPCSVLSLSTVDDVSDRLALIGGASGFLEKLEASKLSPDLRTLTLLADMMEPSPQSLQVMLKSAKQHRVRLDIAFFNTAIRRLGRGSNFEDAKAVLAVMRERNVSMNTQTFGSLALGCTRQEEGLQLLKDMEEAGLKPNIFVFSALIGRAAKRLDYVYLKTLLQTMRDMRVAPNEVIIKQLEFAAQYPPNYDQYKSRNNYLVRINGFRGYYKQWLTNMPALTAEEEQLQSDSAELTAKVPELPDGLTEAERNQKAAARRYKSRHGDKKRQKASAL